MGWFGHYARIFETTMNMKQTPLQIAREKAMDASSLYRTDPEYIAAKKALELAEAKAKKKFKPDLDEAHKELRKQMDAQAQKMTERGLAWNAEETKFFLDVRNGCDWGSAKFVLRWRSPDGRFIIWTCPGKSDWSGVGERSYFSTTHRLADLKLSGRDRGYSLMTATTIYTCDGRLSKSKMENIIKLAK